MSTRLLPQLSHHHDGHAGTISSGARTMHRPERLAAHVLGLWAYLEYTCHCAPPNKPMKLAAPFVYTEAVEL